MALFHSPRIARDNLVLHLDAANSKSYPGTGTTWFDLSGNNNNFTMAGTMVYSGGSFVSDSISNYWYRNPFAHPTTTVSVELWVKCTASSALKGIWSYAVAGNDNHNLLYAPENLSLYGPLGSYSTGVAVNDGLWKQLVRVSDRTNGIEYLYVNGALANTQTSVFAGTLYTTDGSFIIGQEQDAVGGGLDTNQTLQGNYSILKVYNKLLTATDVLNNFNAHRDRYGI